MRFLFRINTEFLFCDILNAVTVSSKQFNVSKIRILIIYLFTFLFTSNLWMDVYHGIHKKH